MHARIAIPMMMIAAGRLRLAGVVLMLLVAAVAVALTFASERRHRSTRDEDLETMARIDRARRG
jgi:hypothetical protein